MSTQEMTGTIEQPKTATAGTSIDSRFSYEAVKVLGVFVAFVPVLFFFTSISLGSLDPAYDWLKNTISELIWGQYGWVLALEFCLFGIVLIALALRLKINFAVDIKSKLALVLLMLIGIGFLIIAVFPTRAPGAAQSISGLIHQNTVRVMAGLFPASCLLFGAGVKRGPQTAIIRIQSLAAGVMGIVLIVPGAVATLTDSAWLGAIERIILINGLLWIEVITLSVTFPGIINHLNKHLGSGLTARIDFQGILAASLPTLNERRLR
jgi:hypothetical protein